MLTAVQNPDMPLEKVCQRFRFLCWGWGASRTTKRSRKLSTASCSGVVPSLRASSTNACSTSEVSLMIIGVPFPGEKRTQRLASPFPYGASIRWWPGLWRHSARSPHARSARTPRLVDHANPAGVAIRYRGHGVEDDDIGMKILIPLEQHITSRPLARAGYSARGPTQRHRKARL
jgi:hypothetical protein